MSVSVSASQLRMLLVAIVMVAFGWLIVTSISDGRAATGTSPAGAYAPIRSVNPVQVQAPVGAPSVPADTASVMMFASRRDPDLATMATLADIYDDIRTSPMWPDSLPTPASLTPAELVRLLGICGGVALGIYGLFAFNVRRRSDRPS
jgi:hypothetical protein